jgi:RNA polymerase sigma factor (sigma-70 family)
MRGDWRPCPSPSSPSPRLCPQGPSTSSRSTACTPPTVARWARRLGGPSIDPDDVVQDVFLVARRRLDRWEPGARITTWLFRTTEKIARRARRRQRLRELVLRVIGANGESERGAGPTPLEQLERDETCRRVYAILDRLPERQRRVLILFELEGLSTQEIADLLGARLPTVRVWLYRARAGFAAIADDLWPLPPSRRRSPR